MYPPCKDPKAPKVKVHLDCSDDSLCDPLPSITIPWTIHYTFSSSSDLNPSTFHSKGLYSLVGNKIDSVSTTYLGGVMELAYPPDYEDLDKSSIVVPVAGLENSTCTEDEDPYCPCNVEVYFFGQGEAKGKYFAIMDAQFRKSGNTLTCNAKQIDNQLDSDNPIDVTFVAVLRYLTLPTTQKITNTFEKPKCC